MSVTDVVLALRRAQTLLSTADAACVAADKAIGEGAAAFATATSGSAQPRVEQAAGYAAAAAGSVQAARAGIAETQALIDAYCRNLDGGGVDVGLREGARESAGRLPTDAEASGGTARSEERYAEWIAELQRAGVKISPQKIIWMARHRDGRLVWLERGHIRSAGLEHIIRPDRAGEFADKGVPRDRVAELVLAGIERGRHVGYVGRDREVYDVVFDGREQRFGVLIADNGFIVTAHPLSPDDENKVRPHPHRR